MPAHLALLSVADGRPNGSRSVKRWASKLMLQLHRIIVFWNYSRALCHSAEPSRPTAGVEDGTLYDTLTHLDRSMLHHHLLNSKVIANLQFVAGVISVCALGCLALRFQRYNT